MFHQEHTPQLGLGSGFGGHHQLQHVLHIIIPLFPNRALSLNILRKGDALFALITTEHIPSVAPDGVVADPGGTEKFQHLQPDFFMAALLLLLRAGLDAPLPGIVFRYSQIV